jgi:DNA-directed RNA polymerase specialized sigma24 family protein
MADPLDDQEGASSDSLEQEHDLTVSASDVSEQELDEFEATAQAQRLQRLAADQELLATLQAQGLQGRDWDRFVEVLARYGLDVMRAWLGSGEIFAKCQRRGWGSLHAPGDGRPWGVDDAEELALETVAIAIGKFRDTVLATNRWTPEGGATLKTFFVGQCLIRFANIYRRWLVETRPGLGPDGPASAPIEVLDTLARPRASAEHGDPAPVVLAKLEVAQEMGRLDPRTRGVLWGVASDYRYVEIAAMLGMDRKAVDNLLARHRSRCRQMGGVA